ncbi:MAG: site-specific DNA-methyltransferase [bacterium]
MSGKPHPTSKPLKAIETILLSISEEKNTVLDLFMGSGTLAVACEKLNRRWIGIEISEEYCKIAKKRIDAEANQMKLFT